MKFSIVLDFGCLVIISQALMQIKWHSLLPQGTDAREIDPQEYATA